MKFKNIDGTALQCNTFPNKQQTYARHDTLGW